MRGYRQRSPRAGAEAGGVVQAGGETAGRERVFKKKVQGTVRERAAAIEPEHPVLSIEAQCRLLGISRSAYYYRPQRKGEEGEEQVVQAIVEVMNRHPFYLCRLSLWRRLHKPQEGVFIYYPQKLS